MTQLQVTQDDEMIERVVEGIRSIHLQKGIEYYLALGGYIIQEMFDGDYAPGSRGHASFRALAERDDLPMSYVTLNAAVRVTHQLQQLPEEARQLTMGHHKALLPVQEDNARTRLAKHAISKAWTVEQLKTKVRHQLAKQRTGSTRGRKPMPKFEKTLNLFRRVLDEKEAFADLDLVDSLPPERAEELHNTLDSLQAKVQELQGQLAERAPRLK